MYDVCMHIRISRINNLLAAWFEWPIAKTAELPGEHLPTVFS